jgi:hypothetical protein
MLAFHRESFLRSIYPPDATLRKRLTLQRGDESLLK